MAFIREFAAGDPFRFRLPRIHFNVRRLRLPAAVRKLRFKGLGRALGTGLSILGGATALKGLGGIFSGLLDRGASADDVTGFARGYGMDPDQVMQLIQDYEASQGGGAMDVSSIDDSTSDFSGEDDDSSGDPRMLSAFMRQCRGIRRGGRFRAAGDFMSLGDPLNTGRPQATRHRTSRHKLAHAGPKHKAAATRHRRSRGHGAAGGPDVAGMLAALGQTGPLADLATGGKRGPFAGPGFGMRKHRRVNPANVKALNRSLRRVEGFEKLARRVMKHKLFKRVRGNPFHHEYGAARRRGKRVA